jgi:hypothetical protein
MPTFNGAAYLPAALDSILAQRKLLDVEIIAVDDGSTDNTLDILESYREKLPLRLVRRSHNGNWVANTNYGLSLARGEWISLLHQDDIWLGGRLGALRKLVDERPEASQFLLPSWYIDASGKRLGLWRCPLPAGSRALAPELVVERLLVQNFIALPAPIFRRLDALDVGGLREDLWYAADWDFWLKLAAKGTTIYTATPLTGFRIHPSSQTIRRSVERDDFRNQLQVVLTHHLETWQRNHSVGSELDRVAQFSVAMNTFLAATVHGHKLNWKRMAIAFLTLGPAGWQRFIRDSRIAERVSARIRARLTAQPA